MIPGNLWPCVEHTLKIILKNIRIQPNLLVGLALNQNKFLLEEIIKT